uniref:RING-type domain-containing protein n=1 Tax=Euplotes harpa TaxID=151035 RepID=A0A7S3IZ72_9SPIT|mmetsp:Transcript_10927/g.12282  ORF Transcript_10927/g.12282 Transcript_10927/m.12282 type:complete len:245 (+) Transcript_10927:39-773(+)
MKKPKEIMTVDKLRYKYRSENTFTDFEEVKADSFSLVDHNDEVISVEPNGLTSLQGTRLERSNVQSTLFALFFTTVNLFRDDKYVYERVRSILYEGDVVTVGGFLNYNVTADSFYIRDVDVITTGGKLNLIEHFKLWKNTYKVAFAIFAICTGICMGFGGYYAAKFFKSNNDAKVRQEFQRVRNQNQNVPEDECCIVCMECRRDIILLPCNHLILCRFCFQEIQQTCPHCSSQIADHVLINFKN